MSLFSISILVLLSIAIPFGILWLSAKTPSLTKSPFQILSTGTLLYFLVKTLGDSGTHSVAALPDLAGSVSSIQQSIPILSTLLAGLLLGLLIPRLLSGWHKGFSLPFWAAVGIGLYNLSQCYTFNKIFLPPVSLGMGFLFVFVFHNTIETLAVTAPLLKESPRVNLKALLFFSFLVAAPYSYRVCGGAFWTSTSHPLLSLSTASGVLLYVLIELLKKMEKKSLQDSFMAMLVVGFVLGWMADSVPNKAAAVNKTVEADGDLPFKPMAWLPLLPSDIKSQDQASNDVLLEKPMKPKRLPDGTKEYDLTASAFTWQLHDSTRVTAWGYNGQVPGPLIRLKVGDKVVFVVKNQLPQPTSVHWHGLAVPNQEDGVPGVSQKAIAPGAEYTYRFVVTPQMLGTHLYHSHFNDDFQVDKGLHGLLIVDPAKPAGKTYDVDAAYEMGSFKVMGSEVENMFTLNGKAYPEAPALRVPLGAKVRVRLVNASAEESHVMHLHGYTFKIIALDGNPVANPQAVNTVLLAPSQTADIAFVANNPGIWMFHCHILDHMINPGPEGDGSETQAAEMGGLMTYVDVVAQGERQTDYQAACSLTKDPTCSRP